ncbi:unnamed protein product [Owenia fusiformis]|uniref:Tetraspanin n=1 Tax=Owenia fusiformis TaxID=6347 RepID=A0A8S4N5B9_OWEFU|nr:unnamed protein product [Owenia fusiformis]
MLKGWGAGGELVDAVDPSLLETAAYVLIGAGSVVFIIAFLGCFGAMKEIRCFLLIYTIIIFLIFGAQVTCGVLAYLFRDQVKLEATTFLNNTIIQKYKGLDLQAVESGNYSKVVESIDPYSAGWDFSHIFFDCCGLYNHTDFSDYATVWNSSYTFTVSGYNINIETKVPVSCCKLKDKSNFPDNLGTDGFVNITGCLSEPTETNTHMTGCYSAVLDYVSQYSVYFIAAAATVAALEIIGMIAACCLWREIGKENDD